MPEKDYLVLYVQAEEQGNTTGGPHIRPWFSDVVANAGASPSLHVGSDGRVVSAVNIRVNGVTNPAAGDPLSAHPYIEVEDLRNAGSADIWMTSQGGAINGGVAASAAPTTTRASSARRPGPTTGARSPST